MSAEFVAKKSYKTNHSSPFRFILSHIGRHPIFAVTLVIGAFSNAALAVAVPYFIGQAFTELSRNPTESVLGFVATMSLGVIVAQLMRAMVQFMRNASAEVYGQRIERDVRDELYGSLMGKSMTFHDLQPVGEIMARVTNDVREMNLMMNPGINLIIGSGMFLIMPVLSAPLIHPALLLVPAIFVISHITVQIYFMRALHPIAQQVRASFGRMNARLAEALDGLQVVKGSAQEAQETENFNDLADTVRDYFIKQGRVEARYFSNLLLPLAIVSGFLHASLLFRAGEIVIGDIVAYTGLLFLFGFPVFISLNAISRIALGYASAERILNIITVQTALDRNDAGHQATIKGEVVFDDVCFGYTDEKAVLHNISFKIDPGKTLAIVGQTGAGKSSVTKLINRIYDTKAGTVMVDGTSVRDWSLASLRSQISIIEQDIFLFSRTIAENIAFGNQNATQEEIEEAAKKAQAHEFITSFADGYETVIGQRGVTLSGGQRQRLAIARAFLANPPILILDDSTSAIDSATEDHIQRAIYAAAEGRTTILITHRLSQIRWADHIVVLRNGTVAAQGTHEELLDSSEAYRRIFARYESGTEEAESPQDDGQSSESEDDAQPVARQHGHNAG